MWTRLSALPGQFRSRQFLIFVAGGGLSALVDIGLMQALLYGGAGAAGAASAGFLAGLVVNYAFHARVTFKRLSTPGTLGRFACLVLLNYLLTLALVSLAVLLADSALLGKLLSLPVVAFNGFLLGKYWIFK